MGDVPARCSVRACEMIYGLMGASIERAIL